MSNKFKKNNILPPIHEDIEYNEFMFMYNQILDLRDKIQLLNIENDKLLTNNLAVTNSVTKYREQLDEKIIKYDLIIKKLTKDNDILKKELEIMKSNNNSDDYNDNDVSCIICYDNKRNVLFKPCNHICICDICSGTTDLKTCILCNVELTSYEYAYLN